MQMTHPSLVWCKVNDLVKSHTSRCCVLGVRFTCELSPFPAFRTYASSVGMISQQGHSTKAFLDWSSTHHLQFSALIELYANRLLCVRSRGKVKILMLRIPVRPEAMGPKMPRSMKLCTYRTRSYNALC